MTNSRVANLGRSRLSGGFLTKEKMARNFTRGVRSLQTRISGTAPHTPLSTGSRAARNAGDLVAGSFTSQALA
jgi:hypothetical protein